MALALTQHTQSLNLDSILSAAGWLIYSNRSATSWRTHTRHRFLKRRFLLNVLWSGRRGGNGCGGLQWSESGWGAGIRHAPNSGLKSETQILVSLSFRQLCCASYSPALSDAENTQPRVFFFFYIVFCESLLLYFAICQRLKQTTTIKKLKKPTEASQFSLPLKYFWKCGTRQAVEGKVAKRTATSTKWSDVCQGRQRQEMLCS